MESWNFNNVIGDGQFRFNHRHSWYELVVTHHPEGEKNMHILAVNRNSISIELSLHEIMIVHQALNETCNALDLPDFSTRMGAELSEATDLLKQTSQIIDNMKHVQNNPEKVSS